MFIGAEYKFPRPYRVLEATLPSLRHADQYVLLLTSKADMHQIKPKDTAKQNKILKQKVDRRL